MPASVAQVVCNGVDQRRTPPTVGCRTRETEWGERRRSSAQVIRCESTWEAARREAASLLFSHRPARVEAAGRLREAMPQACGIGRGERRTPTDRVRTQRKALRPRCPADEAINPNRKTSAQREKDQRQTSTAGRGPRTKDQGQLRRFGPRCVRRTNVKLRSGSIPSWETLWSTRATGITHPGFYGWKPWEKPNNASIITALGTRCEDFRRPTAQIIRFSSHFVPQKFT